MRHYHMLLVLCALIFTMTACSNQSPEAVTESTTEGEQVQQEFTVPEPSSDEVAVVTGKLISMVEDEEAQPILFPVYLGKILVSDDGVEGLVELRKDIAPQASPDDSGNFAFTDVEPGRYGLMMDTPRGAILLKNPVDSTDLIIDVDGGETLELGELSYPIDLGA
ncbi:MAG: hypothetical protein GFH27_549293n166 [Chloroflexi bacterium AL-W]|nr:hypothetical protein [Chloroflexi bacterium AL-N1]NOK67719.1 hypothetical protein [Chloroflexi bacterium AL-N10]NOK75511.1 hypothetical protein [Chloroflexi bacterium AL-N5]NOK82299.1 hypothetical protein [Chloroflexi bacterium AL-W]NOK90144.1 hypothetical protein [Chloroflexi bacterium AL-N15]